MCRMHKEEEKMNILNPNMRVLISFSKAYQEFFVNEFNNGNIEVLSTLGKWVLGVISLELNDVPRLKLKDGKWYKIDYKDSYEIVQWKHDRKSFFNVDGNKHCSITEAKQNKELIIPTSEEIESVKPVEICVDVKINWYSEIRLFVNIENDILEILASDVMSVIKEMLFVGFVFESTKEIQDFPLWFRDPSRTEIIEKAISARFIKL